MIDYHNTKDFKIGDGAYAHDIGFSGTVVPAIPGDSIVEGGIIVEFGSGYKNHKNYNQFMVFQKEDLIHVCDTEAELTPKPTPTHRYLLEDTKYQGAFDMNGDN